MERNRFTVWIFNLSKVTSDAWQHVEQTDTSGYAQLIAYNYLNPVYNTPNKLLASYEFVVLQTNTVDLIIFTRF